MSMDINDDLLQLFIVEKAAYEICYELENRPDWVDVPLRGLLDTLDHSRLDHRGPDQSRLDEARLDESRREHGPAA